MAEGCIRAATARGWACVARMMVVVALVGMGAPARAFEEPAGVTIAPDFCSLYPMAVSAAVLGDAQPGRAYGPVRLGDEAGNFSWLTWTGATDAKTLAASLIPPGDSDGYVNPDDGADPRLDVEDWAQGSPGVANSKSVRERLDALLGRNIIVPVWDEHRGSGANHDYRVERFAIVALSDYVLGGKGTISFVFQRFTRCYNHRPEAGDAALVTPEDTPLSFALPATDADGDGLAYEIVAEPALGAIAVAGGQVTYTPAANAYGRDALQYRVHDGEQWSTVATVSIEVAPVNDAPVAEERDGQLAEDSRFVLSYGGSDVDADPLSFRVVEPPAHGRVDVTPDGAVYVPDADYFGDDAFAYVANDGELDSAPATYALTITPINDAPVADGRVGELAEDTSLLVAFSGSDVEGDSLTFRVISVPAHGHFEMREAGLTYLPAADFHGADSFAYVANDGELDSAPATYALSVTPVNDAPVAEDLDVALDEDSSLALTFSGSDVDGDVLTYAIVSPPSHGRVDESGEAPVYVPDPDYNGADELAYVANDGQLTSSPARLALTIRPVNDAPIITSVAPGDEIEAGEQYRYAVVASDVDAGDGLAYRLSVAPSAMAIDPDSGVIAWATTDADVGQHPVTVEVSDPQGLTASQSFVAVVVKTNAAPLIVSSPPTTAMARTSYTYAVDANDSDAGDVLAYSLPQAPAGMAIDADTGLIAWAPTDDQVGTQDVTVRVNDLAGDSATQSFSIAVEEYVQPPVFTQPPATVARAGHLYAARITAKNRDGGWVTYSLDKRPAGLTIDSYGQLYWRPGDGAVGDHQVVVRATDPWGVSATYGYTLRVYENHPPAFTSTPKPTALSGHLYTYSVAASDPDRDYVKYRKKSGPAGLVVYEYGGVHWTPSDANVGDYQVVVEADDQHGKTALQEYTLTVTLNRPPAFTSTPNRAALSGHLYTYRATAKDPDGDYLKYRKKSGPAGLVVDEYGSVRWTPADGDIGDHQVVVEADDRYGKTASQEYTLTVTLNRPPAFTSTPKLSVRSGYSYSYSAKATDPDGDYLRYSLKEGPAGLRVNVYGNVSWTPSNTQLGGHSVTIIADDGHGKVAEQVYTLTVLVNEPPVITSEPVLNAIVGRPYVYQVEGRDPEGEALHFKLDIAPAGMSIGDSGRVVWNAPGQQDVGAQAIRVLVGDGKGETSTQEFSVLVQENRAPEFVSEPDATAVTGEFYRYQAAAVDPERDSLTYRLVTGPADMSVTPAGLVSWPIGEGASGTYRVGLEVQDIDGATGTQNYDLVVEGNLPPVIVSRPVLGIDEGDSYRYVVEATDDNPGDVLNFAADGFSNHVAMDSESGALTWAGSDHFPVFAGAQNWHCSLPPPGAQPLIDVTNWQILRDEGNHGGTQDWSATEGGTVAKATGNGNPSIFLSDIDLSDGVMEINLRIEGGDNDQIGFVWGLQDQQHYYRLMWDGGNPNIGLNVALIDTPHPRYGPNESTDIRLYNDPDFDWERFIDYRLILDVRPGQATIYITADNKILKIIGLENDRYTSGRFGFFVYSQDTVFYSARRLSRSHNPDLVVDNIKLASSGAADTYAVTVRNRGGGEVDAPSILRLRGAGYSAAAGPVGVVDLAELDMPVLQPGQSQVVRLSTPPSGDYPLIEAAIESDRLLECNQDNNIRRVAALRATVTDAGGLADSQRFVVNVENVNEPPAITSRPPRYAILGEAYQYNVTSSDPDVGDHVSYELVSGPAGMQQYLGSGLLQWLPEQSDLYRDFPVAVRAADLEGLADEQAFTVTVQQKPVITSAPVIVAREGLTYNYQVEASDPEGDALEFRLVEAPDGMGIDPQTGLISWLPPTAGLFHDVIVEVTDNKEGVDEQLYTVAVLRPGEVNTPPEIVSAPPLQARLLNTYAYQVEATDADGDSLRYRLLEGPAAMLMDEATGSLRWRPAITQYGHFDVAIEVNDRRGGVVIHRYQVSTEAPGNAVPDITSTPEPRVPYDTPYTYQVVASDPDGDALRYELYGAPAAMAIDQAGLVTWTPTISDVGVHSVTVRVFDTLDNRAEQSFKLEVYDGAGGGAVNAPPEIVSVPPQNAVVGYVYRYPIDATDADGDALSFELVQAPAGMSIDAAGVLSWVPDAVGDYAVSVRVADGASYAEQGWNVHVMAAGSLSADIQIDPAAPAPGENVTISVAIQDAYGDVSVAATLDGAALALDASYQAVVSFDQPGLHALDVSVSDATGTVTTSVEFAVRDPNDTTPPTVTLTSPTEALEITAPSAVFGSVQADDLASWSLWYVAGEPGAQPVELAQGSSAFAEQPIATFDPTLLFNGAYRIVLQATDLSGNVASDVVGVEVNGAMKLGHFSISFEDLTIPLAGIPITVTRTYDTRQRGEALDFGNGWAVGYQAMRVFESRTPGFGWTLAQEGGGYFPQTCVRPAGGDRMIIVRMPDGGTERFRAKAEPECVDYGAEPYVHLVFEPVGQTTSALEQTDYGLIRVINGHLADPGAPDAPVDPSHYRLTTADGFSFELTQGTTLTQVTDPNDNTLTFSDAGIVHSSGESVDFVRDASGRITRVVAPDGTAVSYAYDASGDLQSVTDPVGNVTSFGYIADHYLQDIVDPRGVRVARNEYDADGRLVAHVDAAGNRIEYDHDLNGHVEVIRDRRGNPTTYLYDDRGYVLSETNALGETTSHTHDQYGNELSRTNALGETTSWSYDGAGNKLTETNALGETTHFAYSPFNQLLTEVAPDGTVVSISTYNNRTLPPRAGNLTALADALGSTTEFVYDTSGSLTKLYDASGELTRYDYDLNGRVYLETAPNGKVTLTSHDANGNVLSETTTRTLADGSEQALVTRFEHDAKGRQVAVTDALGNVTRTEYDGNDKVIAEVDALGRRTEYEYDERGHKVLTRYPDGTTETMAYDANGNEVARTDRAGRVTRMVYDAADRLVETIHPDGSRTRSEYDAAGRLAASIDERGNRSEYAYDAAGRQVLQRDALGRETRHEYDVRGNRVRTIDALGRTTSFVYDAANRLVETVYADGSLTSTSYDELGRRIAQTDQAGITTHYKYDGVGNLTAVIDALGQRTAYGFDEQGNKLTQTDAEGRVTRWVYDDLGRVTSRTLPLGQAEQFVYDAVGNRVQRTDFNGAVSTFSFDVSNRLIREEYADGTVVQTTYTAAGLTDTVTDARGLTDHDYDERDRLTRIAYPNGQVITYAYDAAGNRTQIDSIVGTVDYGFDALNRLSTVTDSHGTTSYSYDEVGNKSGQANANGTSTHYVYNELNRLTRISHRNSSGSVFSQQTYTLGPAGHRLSIADYDGRSVDYGYDALYRLIRETVTDAARGDREALWTYDAVGNRLRQEECRPRCGFASTGATGVSAKAGGTNVVTTYSYDDNDRLLVEIKDGQTTTYGYDANGNTVEKAAPDGTTTYGYDSRDRMVAATTPANELEFAYDANGIRQSRTVDGVATEFVVDPNQAYAQVVAEVDGAAGVVAGYTYGDDLISQDRLGATSTLHYDGLGTTRALSGEGGAGSDWYLFGAFGGLEDRSGWTANDYLFAGEQHDSELGLYYLRARYMAPEVGRFFGMDPLLGMRAHPITLNKYLYANSGPVIWIDPSGEIGIIDISVGLQLYAMRAATIAAPLLYSANHVAMRLGNTSIAMAVRNGTAGIYQRVGLHPNLLRLRAGQMWEKLLKPAMEVVLRAKPQVATYGSRADWVWRGKHVVDAKLGQYVGTKQMANFARWASERGGSVTYISLTRPPPSVYDDISAVASRYGVNASVYWILP